jgi:DNA-binding Lrp family transcriptional regulator
LWRACGESGNFAAPSYWRTATADKEACESGLAVVAPCNNISLMTVAWKQALASRGVALDEDGRMKPQLPELPVGLHALDAIDRRILAELQADGRMTNVELARRAGISAPPCLRRVRRLEEAGIIRGYHADTDPQTLGWEITFFAIVGLESQKQAVLDGFEALVAGWPEVRECHMIRGGGDFLLKLVARDTAHENQLTTRLTGAPSVSRVQTLQTIRTSRSLAGVPL